jgi:hypothetical protein
MSRPPLIETLESRTFLSATPLADTNPAGSALLQLAAFANSAATPTRATPHAAVARKDQPASITATLTAAAVTLPGTARTYTFTITYADPTPIRVTSLGNQDVVVTGPNGFRAPASLRSTAPTTDAASVVATYTITPPNQRWALANNGTYTVTVKPRSVFDTANGFNNPALTAGTFAVTIPFINRPPTFKKGPPITVPQNAGPQTFPNWAKKITNISNPAAKTLTFLVTTNNDALFTAKPTLSPTGTLTFTPAPDKTGTATVTVRLKNSGGTANGGTDTSPPQSFKITIT